MKFTQKVGELSGKLVKSTVAAPKATTNWTKQVATDIRDGYRSVVPKVEKTDED